MNIFKLIFQEDMSRSTYNILMIIMLSLMLSLFVCFMFVTNITQASFLSLVVLALCYFASVIVWRRLTYLNLSKWHCIYIILLCGIPLIYLGIENKITTRDNFNKYVNRLQYNIYFWPLALVGFCTFTGACANFHDYYRAYHCYQEYSCGGYSSNLEAFFGFLGIFIPYYIAGVHILRKRAQDYFEQELSWASCWLTVLFPPFNILVSLFLGFSKKATANTKNYIKFLF